MIYLFSTLSILIEHLDMGNTWSEGNRSRDETKIMTDFAQRFNGNIISFPEWFAPAGGHRQNKPILQSSWNLYKKYLMRDVVHGRILWEFLVIFEGGPNFTQLKKYGTSYVGRIYCKRFVVGFRRTPNNLIDTHFEIDFLFLIRVTNHVTIRF